MPRPKKLPTSTCPQCSEQFEPQRFWQIYCSKRCQQAHHRDEMRKMRNFYHQNKDKIGPSAQNKDKIQ